MQNKNDSIQKKNVCFDVILIKNLLFFFNSSTKIFIRSIFKLSYIIIIIMNLTADQSCSHAVSMSSKHAEKSEKSKNSHLNLLYIYYNLLTVCNNYLASAAFAFLDLNFLNSC